MPEAAYNHQSDEALKQHWDCHEHQARACKICEKELLTLPFQASEHNL